MRVCTMQRKKSMTKYGLHSNSESLFYYICTDGKERKTAKFDLQLGAVVERANETERKTFEYMVSRTR